MTATVASQFWGGDLSFTLGTARNTWWSATLRQMLREPQACRELAELTMRIAQEQGSKIFMMCPLLLGWTLFKTGSVSEGLQQMDEAISVKRQRVFRFLHDGSQGLTAHPGRLRAGGAGEPGGGREAAAQAEDVAA